MMLFLKFSYATVDTIKVSSNQFTPATLNVTVGDSVLWVYVNGFHTTTSLDIPQGATSWDKPMQQNGAKFLYPVKVAGTYNYECSIHTPNMEGVIIATGALPVVLSSFKISATKVNTASLTWSTATELNTDRFDIMRSTDGNNFQKIASVPATGNSSVPVNYSYTDNTTPATYRFVYYSLSIVDKDGKKSASEIERFTNVNVSTKLIVKLSPNPISRPGHLMLQFNSEKENTMHAQLFDATGKLVKQADMYAVAGLNNGHFHIGDVAPGKYTMVFTMDAQKESYSIVVL